MNSTKAASILQALLSLTLVSTSVVACGGSDSSNTSNGLAATKNKKVTSLQYSFAGDPGETCSTGNKVAYSMSDYCSMLMDAARNNNCALLQREKTFDQSCANSGYARRNVIITRNQYSATGTTTSTSMTTGTTTSTGANTITITVTATGTSTGTGTTTAATIPSPSPSAPTPTPVPPPFAFDLRCNFEASQQKTQSGPIVLFSDDRVINMSEQVHEHPLFGNPNHRPAGVRGEIATITNPANPLYGKAYELFTSVKTDKPGMDALNIVTGSNSTSTIHMKGEAGNTNFSNVVGSCGPAKTTIIHEVLPTHYEISCEGTRDLGSDRAVFKTSSVVQVGKPAIMASIYKDITLKNEWIFNIKAPVKAGKMNVAELGLMENRGAIADLNDGKSWDASITLPSSHGSQFRFMAQRLLPKVQPSDPEQTEELVVNCKAEAK